MPSRPSTDRPWGYVLVTVLLSSSVTAAIAWAIFLAPERMLVGGTGQHEASGAAAECLDCHVPFVGTPASRCLSPGCHGDLATGTPPRNGPAMPVRFHVALRDEPCSRCHDEHRRSAQNRLFDHRLIPTDHRKDCRRCHRAEDTPNHADRDAVACGTCHGYTRWGGAKIDHARVDREACELCHRQPNTGQHAAFAGACDTCHQPTSWSALQDAAK